MDCRMPGFPVHHQLLKLTQTHVHWVDDAIQPSHPLSSPSPPAFNLSRHQGLFRMSQFFASGGQSIGASVSASVLPMNIQDWFPLRFICFISLQSKGHSRVFSNTKLSILSCTLLFPLDWQGELAPWGQPLVLPFPRCMIVHHVTDWRQKEQGAAEYEMVR